MNFARDDSDHCLPVAEVAFTGRVLAGCCHAERRLRVAVCGKYQSAPRTSYSYFWTSRQSVVTCSAEPRLLVVGVELAETTHQRSVFDDFGILALLDSFDNSVEVVWLDLINGDNITGARDPDLVLAPHGAFTVSPRIRAATVLSWVVNHPYPFRSSVVVDPSLAGYQADIVIGGRVWRVPGVCIIVGTCRGVLLPGVVLGGSSMGLLGDLFSRLSSGSDSDGEDWTMECRNCGGTAVNSQFCSAECGTEHWYKDVQATPLSHNTNPNCPACSGVGACKLCEDDD